MGKVCCGFDAGTMNLVTAVREGKENKISYKKETNAFIQIPLDNNDKFVFNMMKNSGVPLIERENVAYALGDSAVRMAYSINTLELKRPMASGCVNPKEKDAFQILNIMIHGMLDSVVTEDKQIVCFSVPANAVNQETDAAYHTKILEAIFKAYKSADGYTVIPRPVNEALAINYAELSNKAHTGVSISFGSGQVNVCYAMFGNPLFSFSIVNSGDWIDSQAAKATGESPVFISKEKMKIDLTKEPTTLVERAIQTQYRIMIENTVSSIKKGFQDVQKSIRSDDPVDFVISGGTSSPNGFTELFSETLKNAGLSIKAGRVFRTADTLTSVAKGCLIAAEMN